MMRRRVERLEWAAGTGRAVWEHRAAVFERVSLEALERVGAGEHAPTVRRIRAAFVGEYAPGADMEAAGDRALDSLHGVLPADAFAVVLAALCTCGE